MRKKFTKAIIGALAVSIITSTSAYAETIVRNDRSHRNDIVANTHTSNQKSQEITQNIPAVSTLKENDRTGELEESSSESTALTNHDEQQQEFTIDERELSLSVSDSDSWYSNITYSSLTEYRKTANKEMWIAVFVDKNRFAGQFSSEVKMWFGCTFSPEWHIKATKKTMPYFEIQSNGIKKTIPIKPDSYSNTGFDESDAAGTIRKVVESSGTIKLVVATDTGDTIRIPITTKMLEQWDTILHADLRKLKKENA